MTKCPVTKCPVTECPGALDWQAVGLLEGWAGGHAILVLDRRRILIDQLIFMVLVSLRSNFLLITCVIFRILLLKNRKRSANVTFERATRYPQARHLATEKVFRHGPKNCTKIEQKPRTVGNPGTEKQRKKLVKTEKLHKQSGRTYNCRVSQYSTLVPQLPCTQLVKSSYTAIAVENGADFKMAGNHTKSKKRKNLSIKPLSIFTSPWSVDEGATFHPSFFH